MEKFERFTEKPELKIETLKGPKENEISFCPERGGIITSMKLKGEEILYMEEDTLQDKSKNVRGGIPVLFPNAGPLEEGSYNLKQHGYARTSNRWEMEPHEEGMFEERLACDEEMKKAFPYDLLLRMKARAEEDGSVSLDEEVENGEVEKDLPVAMGLHPYFKVPNEKKKDIKFDFPGGKRIENDYETWSEGGTTIIDNPKIEDSDAVLRIEIPDLGTLIMDVSEEYKKIWIWTLPAKDFICIEPAMRGVGGLTDDPEMVKPKTSFKGRVNFRLE